MAFLQQVNKFNNTGARMLDSNYHMTLNYLKIDFLAWKREEFAILIKCVLVNIRINGEAGAMKLV